MPGTSLIAAGALVSVMLASAADPASKPPELSVDTPGSVVKGETLHLAFTASLSASSIAPGGRVSIAVDLQPKAGMHVYAPGTPYRPVALVMKPHTLLRIHDPVYPEPTLYLFKPLNEAVMVYSSPFRLALDVTVGPTADSRSRLRRQKSVRIEGTLDYQACDDRVCYLPVSVPVAWTLRVESGAPQESPPGPGRSTGAPR